jgi:hypothetical protein
LPLVELMQRVMVRTEIFGQTLPVHGAAEHAA